MLLNEGNYKGYQMIESGTLRSIFTPRIDTNDPRISMTEPIKEDRQLVGYCLGWGLIDYHGGIDGFRSKVILLLDDNRLLSKLKSRAYACARACAHKR